MFPQLHALLGDRKSMIDFFFTENDNVTKKRCEGDETTMNDVVK